MTLIFTSMEPDVSLSPTDLTQKESMGVDTSIAASLPLAPGLVSLRSISSSSSSSRGRRSVVEGNELETQREIRSKTRQGEGGTQVLH